MGCRGSKPTFAAPPAEILAAVREVNSLHTSTTNMHIEKAPAILSLSVPFRRIPNYKLPTAKKNDYSILSRLLPAPLPGAKWASGSLFFGLMQQLARCPNNFVLYDTQPKSVFDRQSLKGAICPWEGSPAAELGDSAKTAKLRQRVAEELHGKTLLLFSRCESYLEDRSLEIFWNWVVRVARPRLKRAYLLISPLAEFCGRFPQSLTNSEFALPGPTEVLFIERCGFCLYMAEAQSVQFNLPYCLDLLKIQIFINMTDRGSGLEGRVPYVYDILCNSPDVKENGRGWMFASVAKLILELSKEGVPVLVYDSTGIEGAAAACAWLMVEMGWSASDSMHHIELMRGTALDGGPLFDYTATTGLRVLEAGMASGVDAARTKAKKAFPAHEDDNGRAQMTLNEWQARSSL